MTRRQHIAHRLWGHSWGLVQERAGATPPGRDLLKLRGVYCRRCGYRWDNGDVRLADEVYAPPLKTGPG